MTKKFSLLFCLIILINTMTVYGTDITDTPAKLVPYFDSGYYSTTSSCYFSEIGLMTDTGSIFTEAIFQSVTKETDSYGFPMWICIQHSKYNKSCTIFSEDGSWSHSFSFDDLDNNMLTPIFMDDSHHLHIGEHVYKIGTTLEWIADTSSTQEDTENMKHQIDITNGWYTFTTNTGNTIWKWVNNTLAYKTPKQPEMKEITLVHYDYVGFMGGLRWEMKSAGFSYPLQPSAYSIYWDGHLYAEDKNKYYILSPDGTELFHGEWIDRKQDVVTGDVYYSALCGDELKLYNIDGKYLCTVPGEVVIGISDSTVYSADSVGGYYLPINTYSQHSNNATRKVIATKLY